ncbi:ABC transporter permease subunit [Agromyces intestinalis]|uniref:ABC transporter permease subunit n=1 Tax=Agromyces intestinalis TaxID=2592652 RepID=A0A5C1YKH6_9MICO|nr:ABC transporter permease subunit [Agromyces intestinalis]QEO15800.1 ABC transporter permease subunit [Agromyces intestinalis]
MTTTTLTAPPVRHDETRPSFARLVHSEWIKLRSLRSTVWSYAIVIAIAVGMAWLMSATFTGGMGGELDVATAPAEQQVAFVVQAASFGVLFGQLVVGVLGVLSMSGEYTTGMIRSTLAATPRRLPALAAKATVLFLTTFAVGVVALLAAFVTANAVFAGSGVSVSLFDPEVVQPLLLGALYLALVSVFALGVGTMLRSSAGGIAAVLGLLLLLPTVLQMLPADWAHDLVPYLLASAGMVMTTPPGAVDPASTDPNAWQSLAITVGWVAASIAGAAVLLRRRDA